jgi:hypothetical protein
MTEWKEMEDWQWSYEIILRSHQCALLSIPLLQRFRNKAEPFNSAGSDGTVLLTPPNPYLFDKKAWKGRPYPQCQPVKLKNQWK